MEGSLAWHSPTTEIWEIYNAVWHCHILSHKDHEMMRVLYVSPGA
jgi:FtsP/CotA-like multicopper oxidase with cupredoxin domain